jgi:hypothetical protein
MKKNRAAQFLDRHPDVWAGLKQGAAIGTVCAAALVMVLPHFGHTQRLATTAVASWHASTATSPPVQRHADLVGHSASADARFIADWVADSRDNRDLPFAILDKREATVYVFDAGAKLVGASPVLLGLSAGDEAISDIGSRPIALVRPEERTTPAGRFVSAPGRNASGEDVVWVDYADSVSMHRVRPVDPKERRLQRLASPDPTERRISYGCINVPVAFYEAVIHPVLGAGRGVVYVLPETKSVRQVFAAAYGIESVKVYSAGNL